MDRKAMAVLVVEDEPLVRIDIADYLRDCGYVVTEVGSAKEAIKVLQSTHVDLVFSDIQMPGEMDGDGLARWVMGNRPDVKVILTSGRVRDCGVTIELIPKPYAQGAVASAIRYALMSSGDLA
ncbi:MULTISPECIES: response regulator [Hyphomicrobiales]|uniref:response regulator n=2 Tax=Hyphomicrobiales TaxID=356 RepID=UPI000F6810AC|nr:MULTISPECIES: response regulator [Hyphomicrobiales]MCQ9147407.1 response regulator [Ochrobactrum sp. BTU2]MDH1270275.1 response regulator [Agrobacterium pusense]MDX4076551.1 response regulator [Brucella sp. NBRC 113783]RSC21589.1 response regulator [Agrobacterium sp. FDAARGOS_525]